PLPPVADSDAERLKPGSTGLARQFLLDHHIGWQRLEMRTKEAFRPASRLEQRRPQKHHLHALDDWNRADKCLSPDRELEIGGFRSRIAVVPPGLIAHRTAAVSPRCRGNGWIRPPATRYARADGSLKKRKQMEAGRDILISHSESRTARRVENDE